MNFGDVRVKEDRLRDDLLHLARFGEDPGGGLMRTALSPADLEARSWFKEQMGAAGLKVREDAAANLIGRLEPAAGPGDAPCIAVGSHIDTVPHGGRFDGAAGICAGLEALRAIREGGRPLSRTLELIVFTDEEGAHFAGTFGSRAMFGLLGEGEIYRSKGTGSSSIAQDLERVGKEPRRIGEARRSPAEFLCYLELHIDQGPLLDSLSIPIGVVEGIVHLDRYLIRVEGAAGHAGTTPMDLRDDALVKAARIVMAVHEAFLRTGAGAVATVGELKAFPGAFNIIPGSVELTLDLRALQEPVMEAARGKVRDILRGVTGASAERMSTKAGVSMDLGVIEAIELSCRARGIPFRRMASGAGHDAMTFPPLGIPTGMIFIPTVGGKSHCPEEEISFEDAALGAQVLADTILRMASMEG